MRILFCGDIMGRTGREALAKHLPAIKQKYAPDVTIVNVENAAGGYGVTLKIAQEVLALGVDCLTTGNHVWNQKELTASITLLPQLIRPLNYPPATAGKGSYLHTLVDGRKILIANLMGQQTMNPLLDCPFAAIQNHLATTKLGLHVNAIFLDFHAEMTSEKVAMGHFLDGQVSAVIGTHTHIPTADEHILKGGTAFQSDAGMCGDFDSVIGMRKELALWRFTRKIPGERLAPAEGEGTVCGVFIETNDKTGLATRMNAIQIGGCLNTRGMN